MSGPTIAVPTVDAVQIMTIMDNTINMFMAGTEAARRLPLGPNLFDRPASIAQHGFSVLIRVRQGAKQGVVLYDTGVDQRGLLDNLDAMEIDPAEIQAIFGHASDRAGAARCLHRKQHRHEFRPVGPG